MYKLVVFDLDGTLLDTLGDLAAAGNHALEQLGFAPHPVEAYKLFVGNGIPNLIHRILPQPHSDEQHEKCFVLFSEYYSAHKSDLTVPYDGVVEIVKKLADKGVVCCVNTNKAHEFACELVKNSFGDTISAVIGQGNGFALKPSPEAVQELCRRFGVQASETLFVGDSNVDMRTASAAGVDSCAVLWGFRSRDELEACAPTHIVSDAQELYRAIIAE